MLQNEQRVEETLEYNWIQVVTSLGEGDSSVLDAVWWSQLLMCLHVALLPFLICVSVGKHFMSGFKFLLKAFLPPCG